MAYTGFQALTQQLANRSGVHDPAALAAAIGRKKHGASAMEHAAKTGHSLKGHQTQHAAYSDAVKRLTSH